MASAPGSTNKKKTLFETCVETLSNWTIHSHAEYGTAIQYAIIADPTPLSKHLIIAIRDEETFPPRARELQAITLYDTWHFEGDSDEKGMTYPVIGIVEDGALHLNCGEEYFARTFFDGVGRLKGDVVVNDPERREREGTFGEVAKGVENGKTALAKEKKKAKKERREKASTVPSVDVDKSVESAEAAAAKERKREKRRVKDARQKERRKAAAEEAVEMQKAGRAKMYEELQAKIKDLNIHQDA